MHAGHVSRPLPHPLVGQYSYQSPGCPANYRLPTRLCRRLPPKRATDPVLPHTHLPTNPVSHEPMHSSDLTHIQLPGHVPTRPARTIRKPEHTASRPPDQPPSALLLTHSQAHTPQSYTQPHCHACNEPASPAAISNIDLELIHICYIEFDLLPPTLHPLGANSSPSLGDPATLTPCEVPK